MHRICLFFVSFLCSTTIFSQKKIKDTVFFSNELHQKVYVEPDKYSTKYKTLVDFQIGDYWGESYFEQLKQFEAEAFSFRRFSLGKFPRQWVTIKLYQSKPYAYYPCDFINYSAIVFTDSTLLQFSGEPPQVEPLLDFKKIDEKTYQAVTTQRIIKFHFITINGEKVVLLESQYDVAEQEFAAPLYQLMIQAKSITDIPMIVNDCIGMKQMEFIFDNPDFSNLLEGCP
jgi:hypothetical protein